MPCARRKTRAAAGSVSAGRHTEGSPHACTRTPRRLSMREADEADGGMNFTAGDARARTQSATPAGRAGSARRARSRAARRRRRRARSSRPPAPRAWRARAPQHQAQAAATLGRAPRGRGTRINTLASAPGAGGRHAAHAPRVSGIHNAKGTASIAQPANTPRVHGSPCTGARLRCGRQDGSAAQPGARSGGGRLGGGTNGAAYGSSSPGSSSPLGACAGARASAPREAGP